MRKFAALMLGSAALLTVSGHAQVRPPQLQPSLPNRCTVQGAEVPGVAIIATRFHDADNHSGLPAHCEVQGRFEQRTGAGAKPYSIAFELRLPEAWNGRLLFQGGGGLNGAVNPALGGVIGSAPNTGLTRGFAVVSTDSGHHGTDASFASDQLAKLNYAYASIGKVAITAKEIVAQLTGSRPQRTYFAGCSNGGREAMLAAQRFPEEFDGVIAGSPAFDLSDAVLLAHFSTSVYRAGAPKAPDGTPELPLALTPSDTKLLSTAVLRQCDALDGAQDGFIFNHTACRFDPQVLQCKRGQHDSTCLPAAKILMIRKAFAGPLGRDGKPLVSSWTYDSGVDSDLWRIWQEGLMLNGKPVVILPRLIDETLARYFNYPMLDPIRLGPVDTAAMLLRISPTAAMTDATSTEMSTFAARGGKMLIVSGWSEPVFAPSQLISWYDRMNDEMTAGSNMPARTYARLFMVPGMNHCGGGPSLDQFDALGALMDWVEKGEAPDQMIATGKSYPGVSRPLCAYPKLATYRNGPQELFASYSCDLPKMAFAK